MANVAVNRSPHALIRVRVRIRIRIRERLGVRIRVRFMVWAILRLVFGMT